MNHVPTSLSAHRACDAPFAVQTSENGDVNCDATTVSVGHHHAQPNMVRIPPASQQSSTTTERCVVKNTQHPKHAQQYPDDLLELALPASLHSSTAAQQTRHTAADSSLVSQHAHGASPLCSLSRSQTTLEPSATTSFPIQPLTSSNVNRVPSGQLSASSTKVRRPSTTNEVSQMDMQQQSQLQLGSPSASALATAARTPITVLQPRKLGFENMPALSKVQVRAIKDSVAPLAKSGNSRTVGKSAISTSACLMPSEDQVQSCASSRAHFQDAASDSEASADEHQKEHQASTSATSSILPIPKTHGSSEGPSFALAASHGATDPQNTLSLAWPSPLHDPSPITLSQAITAYSDLLALERIVQNAQSPLLTVLRTIKARFQDVYKTPPSKNMISHSLERFKTRLKEQAQDEFPSGATCNADQQFWYYDPTDIEQPDVSAISRAASSNNWYIPFVSNSRSGEIDIWDIDSGAVKCYVSSGTQTINVTPSDSSVPVSHSDALVVPQIIVTPPRSNANSSRNQTLRSEDLLLFSPSTRLPKASEVMKEKNGKPSENRDTGTLAQRIIARPSSVPQSAEACERPAKLSVNASRLSNLENIADWKKLMSHGWAPKSSKFGCKPEIPSNLCSSTLTKEEPPKKIRKRARGKTFADEGEPTVGDELVVKKARRTIGLRNMKAPIAAQSIDGAASVMAEGNEKQGKGKGAIYPSGSMFARPETTAPSQLDYNDAPQELQPTPDVAPVSDNNNPTASDNTDFLAEAFAVESDEISARWDSEEEDWEEIL